MEEKRTFLQHELEREVLERLQSGDVSIGQPNSGLIKRYAHELHLDDTWPHRRLAEVIWELQRRGLIYFSFADNPSHLQANVEEWQILLTERGKAAATASNANPDDPGNYLEQFASDIPQAPEIVRKYIREALETYAQQCYLACAVMLGVAAEAAFFDLLDSFVKWLPPREAQNLQRQIQKRGTPYSKLLEEFRRHFDSHRNRVSSQLRDGLDIQFNAVLDLIRAYRNDAGHPTGSSLDQQTCFVSFVIFHHALQRLYALKYQFDSEPYQQGSP